MTDLVGRRNFLAWALASVVHALVPPTLRADGWRPLLYSRCHMWVDLRSDVARIGLSEHAVQELGDVVFVELPTVGSTYGAGRAFATIEAIKTVVELMAPVTGTVVRVNPRLDDRPELVNESPLNEGWLCEVTLVRRQETRVLMSRAQYGRYLQGPADRCA